MKSTSSPRVLAVCNTPFQLISVVWLRMCFYKDAVFHVIVTDQVSNVEPIVERLRGTGAFDRVTLVRDNDYSYWHGPKNKRLKTKWDKAWDYFTRGARRRALYTGDTNFDEFLLFNHSRFSLLLYEKLWQRNRNIRVSIYEEGIGCYDHISRCYYDPKYAQESNSARRRKLDQLFRRPCLSDNIHAMYVFIPEMLQFHPPIDIIRIPPLDATCRELTDVLFAVFDCANAALDCKQDVILFEESYASDGWKFDYQPVLDTLSKAYGKDNIIVKQHPRSRLTLFAEQGYAVFPGSNVPWEVLLLKNPALADKLWVSYCSGSMLCAYFYLGLPVKAISLMDLIPQPLGEVQLSYFAHIRKNLFERAPQHYLVPSDEAELSDVEARLQAAGAQSAHREAKAAPQLSVVLCVYNGVQIMRPAIESVLKQDFTDFELLCVDDGSTDDTVAVFEEYAAADDRVVVIKQEQNTGLFRARVNGINHAKGDYVLFLDADDSYAPGAFREINEKAHFYHPDVFHYAVDVVPEVEGETAHIASTRDFHAPLPGAQNPDKLLRICFCNNCISRSMWSKAFRRETIQQAVADVDDTRVDYGDDAYLIFMIFYYARSYYGDPSGKRYYVYVYSPDLYIRDKLTDQQFTKYAVTWGRVSVKCKEFLEKRGELERYREEWEALSRDIMLRPTIYFLLYRLEDSQRGAGFATMCQYWGTDEILREFKHKIDSEIFVRAKAERSFGFRVERKLKKIRNKVLRRR